MERTESRISISSHPVRSVQNMPFTGVRRGLRAQILTQIDLLRGRNMPNPSTTGSPRDAVRTALKLFFRKNVPGTVDSSLA